MDYGHRSVLMAPKMAFVLVCLGLLTTSASGQTSQIQGVIDGLISPQHAAEINAVLAAQPGVWMSRTDANTKNLLMHVAPTCNIDPATIDHLLQPFGASVRCFRREPLRPGQFRHLDPQTCGSGQPQDR